MSVWNKLGDLGKGLGDWGKDVGLMAVSGPKFFWDIATAPWNDRKEFNGFLNTITNATIDANKNVFRPLGGALAAVAATNKNILREPLAAVLSLPDEFSLSEGLVNPERRKKNQEQWKKAWDNRQEVSFGQGLAPTQPQNIILKGISSITNNEDFLPQYLKSDFDIYDKTQRDKAFKSSIYGAITSNVGDVGAQLGLDVTLGASKLIKVATAADDSFTAIKGINAAHAGEANKYSKMAEDFAANTDLWALNHPWVKKSNDISTTAHLLGTASTKEEALYTMAALLGDSGAVAKLDILKRPDIAEPIKIASGELTRRGLKTFLRDEAKIATTTQEGMLNLGLLRTPEEIAIDTEFLKAYATHDKYISRLMGIATPGSAPLTQGVGLNITQKIGAELATARTVPFHSLEVGMPSVETYQPTPFHRMYHILSWAERERPNGLMNLNEGESIKEVTTTADRIVKKGLSDYPTMGAAISKYAAAATPEAKKLAAQEFEAIGFRGLAKKYDLSVDQIETILTNHRLVKDGFLKEAKEQGYVYDAVTDTNLKSAFFESQTSNFYALADFDHIDNVIRSTRGALKYAWESKDKITNTLESVNDLWKASVLLRLGYPVRNGIDSQLRIAAAVGSMAVLKHLGPGANNLIYNTNQEAIRLIDKVKNANNGIKTLSYEATQLQMQNLGKEIAGHELVISQLNKALDKNPNDIDAINRLVAEQLKLDTKKVAFDSNNASLTKIEQAKVASKKRGIGQGEMLLPSTFDTADGFTYGFADGFSGSTGELFQSLNSGEKIYSRILDDWSNIYKTKTIKGSRGSVTPDKANYYTEWSKAINETLGNSAVVRKLLDDKSKIEDVVKWLKDDPKGILLRQRLNLSANESEEYVYQASSFLNSHMPKGTGIREKILGPYATLKSKFPYLEDYKDGGSGGLVGSRSTVGFVKVEALKDMPGNTLSNTEGIDALRKSIRKGMGFATREYNGKPYQDPIMVVYDNETGLAYIGEGNHRLQAAIAEGLDAVPVRVVRGHKEEMIGPFDGGRKPKQIKNGKEPQFVETVGTLAGKPVAEGYVPPEMHPSYVFDKEFIVNPNAMEASKVTEEFLRNAIKDPAKLPIVNGFLIEDSLGNISNLNLKSVINAAFKFLGSRPENAWARNPLFLELYTRSAEKRLALAEGLNKGRFTQEEFQGIQRDIEMGARKDALKGVNQILYNVERRSNLAESLRFISPFLSAQENALKVWLKLGGQNINIFNRAAILWNAPNSAGLVTDKNGDIVPPYKSYNPDDTMWFQVPKSMKRLPIIGKGLESLDQVGISKRTMDVVFMGSPYSLSVGPYFGVVAANIIKWQPSTSAVLSWAFPYGPDDSFKQFLPTFLRRQLERAQGLDNTTYANTFGLIWQTEMHKARDEKRPYPTEKEIKAKADAFYSMRTFAALILPVAPQFDSPYKLYIDKYRIYMEKYGIQAQSKFFEDYPEFFDFAISFSENKTKVAPTMTAVENSRRYAGLIAKVKDDNPALIGMIVNGSSTSKFNPTAYWLQQGTSISPGSKEKFRGSQTPLEAAKSNEAKEGWIRFRKIQDFIDVQLTARGLNSTTQKGAEDLARLKTAIITVLSTKQDPVTGKSTGEVSAWFEDYNDVNRVKVLKTVSGLKKTIADTKFMEDNKNNPTWKSVVVYMKIRNMLALQLGARESANIDAKSNSDIRFLYDVIVKKLKSDDIGFSDMYDRYLSQDTVYNKYLGAANG